MNCSPFALTLIRAVLAVSILRAFRRCGDTSLFWHAAIGFEHRTTGAWQKQYPKRPPHLLDPVASQQMLDLSTLPPLPRVSDEHGFEAGRNHVYTRSQISRRHRQILNC